MHQSYQIVEIFKSIQGEGPRLVPAIFTRFGGCNFSCKGFNCSLKHPKTLKEFIGCDSIYAANSTFKDQWFKKSKTDILDSISKLTSPGIDVVITGGEPALQLDSDLLEGILKLPQINMVTIETNGSLTFDKISKPFGFQNALGSRVQLSISLKLPTSGESKARRLNFKNLEDTFERFSGGSKYFKFVSSAKTWDSDIIEILEVQNKFPEIQIYLMPLGENKNNLDSNTRFIFEKCIEYNFGYSDRAHIRAFNDLRGV